MDDYDTLCEIHRSEDGSDFDYIMSIQCNSSFTDLDLDEETTYYYKSKVENVKKYSEVVSATTKANDYDEPNNEYSDTITFSGFEFKKVSGYTYSIEDTVMTVELNDMALAFLVFPIDYQTLKTPETIQQVIISLESSGYLLSNQQTRTVYGTEMVTFDMTYAGMNMLYAFASAPNGYSFQILLANSDGTINYDDLYHAVILMEDVKFVGGYSDYTTEFGTGLDI